MFKNLDKYMDNLKSPYWEVYFWIFVIAIGIAGTVVIFIDPVGVANKLGNAGSFLGGLFTITAVFIAIVTYKSGKSEYKNRLVLDRKSEIVIEIIPEIQDALIFEIMDINTSIEFIKGGNNELIEGDIISSKSRLIELKSRLDLHVKYLVKFNSLNKEAECSYNTLIELITNTILYRKVIAAQNKLDDVTGKNLIQEIVSSNIYKTYFETESSYQNFKEGLFKIENKVVEGLISEVLEKYFSNIQ